MAPQSVKVPVPSRPLKRGVQSTIKKVDKAVAKGKQAVKASVKAAREKPTAKNINAVVKNSKTLAKAEQIRERLKDSQDLAEDLCPLNILVFVFEYVG